MKGFSMPQYKHYFLLCLFMAGCTTQAWYESAKQKAESDCRNQTPSETERCLQSLNNKSYKDYAKERSGQN